MILWVRLLILIGHYARAGVQIGKAGSFHVKNAQLTPGVNEVCAAAGLIEQLTEPIRQTINWLDLWQAV